MCSSDLPIALVMVTPLVWMLVTSIETVSETRQFPPVIIPSGVHYQNYSSVLTEAFYDDQMRITAETILPLIK